MIVSRGQVDDPGDYEFRFVPSRSASYVVTYTATGAGPYFSGSLAARFVPLTVGVSLRRPAVTVKSTKATTLTGSVSPAQVGSTAQLQIYLKGAWKTLATARCDSTGKLIFQVKLKHKGTYKYRVRWRATPSPSRHRASR